MYRAELRLFKVVDPRLCNSCPAGGGIHKNFGPSWPKPIPADGDIPN